MADETKRETMQQFNLKLYPQDIDRFNTILGSMENVNTKVQALSALMDFWENPKAVVKDNPALVQRIAELEAEAQKRTDEMTKLRADIETLTSKNTELQQTANDNGQASTALQLRIDELETENAALRETKNVPENVITTEVHPVAWFFLKKMSESETKRTGKTVEPGKILTELFIRDLQNPRTNNLPYIVSTSEINDVKTKFEAAMKKKAEAEQKEAEQKPAEQEAEHGA